MNLKVFLKDKVGLLLQIFQHTVVLIKRTQNVTSDMKSAQMERIHMCIVTGVINQEPFIVSSCSDLRFDTETSEKTSETDVVGVNTVYFYTSGKVV